MNVVHLKKELTQLLKERRKSSDIVGFVPTMGALHEGHFSLIRQALADSDCVVVSIFVNPTQFDNPDDLQKYPKSLEQDVQKLKGVSDDLILFIPTTEEIYTNGLVSEEFDFGGLTTKMEGKYRNGHFEGVGTVLKKLFHIVQPDKAFFGEKDYQQLLIVKKLVALLKLPIAIISCPISREKNGLARSSRNRRLSDFEQEEATLLYKSLVWAKKNFGKKSPDFLIEKVKRNFELHPQLHLDYFEIADAATLEHTQEIEEDKKYRAFIAAYYGEVRLIDNIALN